MSLLDRIKLLLKMCGHAFVITVHGRLDHTDRQLDIVIDQNNRLAQSQTALLQASIHFIEASRRAESELRRALEERIRALEALLAEEREGLHRVEIATVATRTFLEREVVRQVEVQADDYGFSNPEVGLLAHLYSFLPSRKALDIGAHAGEVSERLLDTGYEVFAFEPCLATYEKLVRRLGNRTGFRAFQMALGSDEARMMLHIPEDMSDSGQYGDPTAYASLAAHGMPDDLPFKAEAGTTVRRLDNLHREQALPEDIALVKIDTEGFDLEVIRGMGDRRYPVIAAEFWDGEIPFAREGLSYTLESLAAEMKERGYPWDIVIYRLWGQSQLAFYANHPKAVANSWGNVVFFRDYQLFREAQLWCSAVLPRTYFKPVLGCSGADPLVRAGPPGPASS